MAAVYARAHSAAEARQEALKLRDRALQRQAAAWQRSQAAQAASGASIDFDPVAALSASSSVAGKRRAYKRTGKQIPYPPNQPSPVLDPAEIPQLTGTGNHPPAQDDDNPLDIQSRDGWINFFSSPMRPDAFKSNTKEIPLAADRSLPPLEVYTPHGANGHGVGVRVQGDSTRPAVLEISGGETANSWMYDLPSLPARPSYLGHLLSPSDPSTTTNPLSTHTTTQHHSHPPKGTEGRVDEDGAGGRGRVGEPPSSGNNSVTSMAAAQRGASSPRSLPPAQRSDKQAREMRTRVVAPPLELGVDGPWERDDVVRSESESGSGAAEHADDEHDHKRSSSESKSREHAKTWRSSKSVKSVKKAVSGIWHGGGNSDSSKDPSRKGLSRKRVRAKTSHNLPVHKLNEMGQIVDKKGHQAWDMACGLQNGIRVMVSMNSHKTHGIEPDFECFQEKIKLKFPTAGSSLTPPHDGPAFTFKDYTPQVFRELRSIFGIDTADYMVALCNTQPDGSNALRIMGTPGKSGSLFFFSNDMKFIVKTLPKREAKLLLEILPNYFQHVKQNPGTYLPRFYGLHRWKPEFGRNVRFVVMNNVFATNLGLHKRFDLKGSTLGRKASAADKAKGARAILKDLDLLEGNYKVKLGKARKRAFLDQIRSDCHLLMSLKIMDYSLLLGIHQREHEACLQTLQKPFASEHLPLSRSPTAMDTGDRTWGLDTSVRGDTLDLDASLRSHDCDFQSSKHAEPSSAAVRAEGLGHVSPRSPAAGGDGSWRHIEHAFGDPGHFNPDGVEGCNEDGTLVGERYFVGIIDILMLYTRRKRLERLWKSSTEGAISQGGVGGCSSQPPAKYAIRFCKWIDNMTE